MKYFDSSGQEIVRMVSQDWFPAILGPDLVEYTGINAGLFSFPETHVNVSLMTALADLTALFSRIKTISFVNVNIKIKRTNKK